MTRRNFFKNKSMDESDNGQQIILMQNPSNNMEIGMPMMTGIGGIESDPRTLWLTSEIHEGSALGLIQEIHAINYHDDKKEKEYALDDQVYNRKPITIRLSSWGGCVYSGTEIMAAIQRSKTPVVVIASGKIMSMAVPILLSGHKRYAEPFTSFLIHSTASFSMGKWSGMEEDLNETKRLQKMIDDYIISRTQITAKRLNEVHKTQSDWYFSVEDALRFGIIEEIL